MSAVLENTPLPTLDKDAPAAMPLAKAPGTMPRTADPSGLILYAMDQGADIERLERLFDLQVKWEANEARKAFVAAMGEFKRNPPEIYKRSHVEYKTDKGVTAYDHASIGDVTSITAAALAQHGLSHRWDTEQGEGGRITVRCILTHAQGHSESTELSGSPDASGGKNNIQAVGSTITYLQRYTLLAACGLATKDQADDDGVGAGGHADGMSEEEVADWGAKIDELTSRAEADELWQTIFAACDAARDVPAADHLRVKLNAKVKGMRR